MKKLLLPSLGLLAAQFAQGQAWINEIHYDNIGGDVGEFIEVLVEESYAGSLDDLRVSLYNGSDDELYGSNDEFLIGTDFVVGDTVPGLGTFYSLTLPANGLQNGAPDGIALSLLSGGTLSSVIDFISYEGVVGPAGDGDAVGLSSVDIGVSENNSSTPIGTSLGLIGNGAASADFTWAVISNDTPGSLNDGQTLGIFVAPVAAATATATAADSVELSFTSNGSDDVLIVRNTSGTFSEPSGAAPAPGNAFAGGTVVYKGASSPQTDSGLTPDVEVFYAFFSVTSGDLYSTSEIRSAIPNKILLNTEDFSGASTWVNESVSGTDPGWDTTGGDAFISGFGQSPDENHYLVSPAFDFSTAAGLLFEFTYSERFTGPDLTILYSTNYTGTGNPETNGVWIEVPFSFVDTSDSNVFSGPTSGSLSLPSGLEGEATVYLAFKYISDGSGTGSENWLLDDLVVSRSAASQTIDPEPSEGPSSFAASSTGISSIGLTWTDAAGAQAADTYLILANTTGTFSDPVDGTPISLDPDLSDGSAALTVSQGTGSADFTGLQSGTQFFFKIFSYTNAGVNIDYNLVGAQTADATTDSDDPEPVAHPTGFSAQEDLLTIDLAWTDASNTAGYLLLANTTGIFTPPVDGVDPTEDSDLTDGSALLKILEGTETATLVGLPGTQYFFTLYPYSNSGLNIDFKTDGTPVTADATTDTLPVLIISEIMQNPDSASDSDGEYFEVYNADSSPVDLIGYTIADDGGNSHVIASSVIIPVEGYAVFGRNATTPTNGNLTVDYVYGNDITLANGADEVIIIAPDGVTEVDRVNYDGGPDFPDPTGAAMIYIGGIADDNNDSSFWATATQREPGFVGQVGDSGSPGFTGSGQNLPSLTFPANASASTETATSNALGFDSAFGNDVLVVFNTTGTFSAPSGPAPAVGQSFAGGTILYKGAGANISHTGLSSGVEVFYAFFSVTPSDDYSPSITRSAIPGLIAFEDFSADPIWTNRTVFGDDPWDISSGVATADGADLDPETFEDLVPVTPDRHYLVSPALDFSTKGDISLEFVYGEAFDGPDIQLVYSVNYSGSGDPEDTGVTWTPIALSLTDSSGEDPTPDTPSGPVDLSVLDGLPNVRLAFIYAADGTGANSEIWSIDDIELSFTTDVALGPLATYLGSRGLSESNLDDDTNGNGYTVLEEYLAGFGDAAGPDVIEYNPDGTKGFAITSDLENEPAGITVTLLASSDLGVAFAPVAFTTNTVNNGDGTFTRNYVETTPPAGDQRFYQLQINQD